MARMRVDLPEALRGALRGRCTTEWLRMLDDLPATEVSHDAVAAAVRAAQDEMGTRDLP